ncbi:MAG TPA: hypothetical protein VMS32_06685 [Verrucomicrobiae bacterium]|nr:hypothetical protein [Verrucomicrobiae bacterium]
MTWIYSLPLGLFAPLAIAAVVALALLGLLLVYRYVHERERFTHNDVAGPVIGIAGTVLAVMLSFMVVAVWQEFDAAATNVQSEASAVADLYHLANAFPVALRRAIQTHITTYVDTIVGQEWPLMETGRSSQRARRLVGQIQRDVVGYAPTTAQQQQVQTQASQLTQAFVDERRQRLFDNEQGIPHLMWFAMMFVGFVTIGFIYLFRVQSFIAHVLMTVGTAAIIAVIFVLIAEMDYPFRGDSGLAPTPFLQIQAAFHDPTGRAGYY